MTITVNEDGVLSPQVAYHLSQATFTIPAALWEACRPYAAYKQMASCLRITQLTWAATNPTENTTRTTGLMLEGVESMMRKSMLTEQEDARDPGAGLISRSLCLLAFRRDHQDRHCPRSSISIPHPLVATVPLLLLRTTEQVVRFHHHHPVQGQRPHNIPPTTSRPRHLTYLTLLMLRSTILMGSITTIDPSFRHDITRTRYRAVMAIMALRGLGDHQLLPFHLPHPLHLRLPSRL
jgi:hypothetical protein